MSDDRCASVSATPVSRENDDGDQVLERPGTDGLTSEVWLFRCSYTVGAHPAPGEANGQIVNTASATALDENDNAVGPEQATHTTRILHPAIAVRKLQRRGSTGPFAELPVTVHAGDTIEYRFELTNPGDAPLGDVTVTDPRCDGAITGPTGDDGDSLLEPAETWVYACAHTVLASDGDGYTNTVTVGGTDELDDAHSTVTASDTAIATVLAPGLAVDKRLRRGASGPFVEGPITVRVGDTIEYAFTVINTGNTPLTVGLSDPRCDGAPAGPSGDGDGDGLLDVAETWVYTCAHVVTAADGPLVHNVVTATGTDTLGGSVTVTDSEDAHVGHPGVAVVKDGPAVIYHGDTVVYTFAVSNTGDEPLHDVTVADDHCAVGAVPAERRNDDGDGLLENPGVDGQTSEVWTFTCTYALPAHGAGEENPVHNVATVTATDELGTPHTDTDDHSAPVLHPAIELSKSGPASATAGDRVTYSLLVTNPGDVALVGQSLQIDDPQCDAPPVLEAKRRGDAPDPTPDTLDPGDAWTYTCTVPTSAGQTTVLNRATATATDVNGRTVADSGEAGTTLAQAPVQLVLTETNTVFTGDARLRGPTACVPKRFRVRISGTRIASVRVKIDGRTVRRWKPSAAAAQRSSNGSFSMTINAARWGDGIHRLVASVTYTAVSNTPPRTLRMTFTRCARQLVRPQFTG